MAVFGGQPVVLGGAHRGQPQHPALQVLGDANLVIDVVADGIAVHVGLVLQLLITQVSQQAPSVAQVERGRAVQVPGAFAVRGAEEVAGRVGVLQRVVGVGGAQVQVGVVVVAALGRAGTRVVVMQHTGVQGESAAYVAFPAAVEIHFEVAVGEYEVRDVGVPVAQIEAGTMGQVEAHLHGGTEIGLRIAAEAIVADDGRVTA
ncbi:hypothetical protein D3C71_1346220 [compost metagenome]